MVLPEQDLGGVGTGSVQLDVPEIHVLNPEGGDGYEPGLPYRLDSSMSPEGRREYGV